MCQQDPSAHIRKPNVAQIVSTKPNAASILIRPATAAGTSAGLYLSKSNRSMLCAPPITFYTRNVLRVVQPSYTVLCTIPSITASDVGWPYAVRCTDNAAVKRFRCGVGVGAQSDAEALGAASLPVEEGLAHSVCGNSECQCSSGYNLLDIYVESVWAWSAVKLLARRAFRLCGMSAAFAFPSYIF